MSRRQTNILILGVLCLVVALGASLYDLILPTTSSTATRVTLLLHLRIPQVMAACLIGAGLALSGTLIQTILKNPLAEPFTLGISGSAALGISLGFLFSLSLVAIHALGILFCLITLVILSCLSQRHKASTLILGGIMLNFFFSSSVMLIFAFSSPEQLKHMILWLMGDLSFLPWIPLTLLAFTLGLMSFLSLVNHRSFDLLSFGGNYARQMGVPVSLLTWLTLVGVSLITSISVVYCGLISFVGLMIPHFLKRTGGPHHRFLLWGSLIWGSTFLLICDTLARTLIAPMIIPIGVITGFIGGASLLFLLSYQRRGWEGM